jgi:hypothetical protein
MGGVPDTDLERIKQFCDERSPAENADQVRIENEVRGKTVTIIERQPPWKGGGEWTSQELARLKYDEVSTEWTLYWSDSGRFHICDFIGPGTVTSLLDEVDQDPTCIFWADAQPGWI